MRGFRLGSNLLEAITNKDMGYLDEVDAWLPTTLPPKETETEEEWMERVKKQIKAKILESYRNGQKAPATSRAKTTDKNPRFPSWKKSR